jgi:hypothetical protein
MANIFIQHVSRKEKEKNLNETHKTLILFEAQQKSIRGEKSRSKLKGD